MRCGLPIGDNRIKTALCPEKQRLLDDVLETIRDLVSMQQQQLQAVINKDPDFARFDILLEMASARKRAAKYAYLKHVRMHEC
jgi:hypothetical protein